MNRNPASPTEIVIILAMLFTVLGAMVLCEYTTAAQCEAAYGTGWTSWNGQRLCVGPTGELRGMP